MNGDADQDRRALKAYVRTALPRDSPAGTFERANQSVAADDRKMFTHRTLLGCWERDGYGFNEEPIDVARRNRLSALLAILDLQLDDLACVYQRFRDGAAPSMRFGKCRNDHVVCRVIRFRLEDDSVYEVHPIDFGVR